MSKKMKERNIPFDRCVYIMSNRDDIRCADLKSIFASVGEVQQCFEVPTATAKKTFCLVFPHKDIATVVLELDSPRLKFQSSTLQPMKVFPNTEHRACLESFFGGHPELMLEEVDNRNVFQMMADNLSNVVHTVTDKIGNIVEHRANADEDAFAKASEVISATAQENTEGVKKLGERTLEAGEKAVHQTAEMGREAMKDVADMGSKAAHSLAHATESAKEKLVEAGSTLKKEAHNLFEHPHEKIDKQADLDEIAKAYPTEPAVSHQPTTLLRDEDVRQPSFLGAEGQGSMLYRQDDLRIPSYMDSMAAPSPVAGPKVPPPSPAVHLYPTSATAASQRPQATVLTTVEVIPETVVTATTVIPEIEAPVVPGEEAVDHLLTEAAKLAEYAEIVEETADREYIAAEEKAAQLLFKAGKALEYGETLQKVGQEAQLSAIEEAIALREHAREILFEGESLFADTMKEVLFAEDRAMTLLAEAEDQSRIADILRLRAEETREDAEFRANELIAQAQEIEERGVRLRMTGEEALRDADAVAAKLSLDALEEEKRGFRVFEASQHAKQLATERVEDLENEATDIAAKAAEELIAKAEEVEEYGEEMYVASLQAKLDAEHKAAVELERAAKAEQFGAVMYQVSHEEARLAEEKAAALLDKVVSTTATINRSLEASTAPIVVLEVTPEPAANSLLAAAEAQSERDIQQGLNQINAGINQLNQGVDTSIAIEKAVTKAMDTVEPKMEESRPAREIPITTNEHEEKSYAEVVAAGTPAETETKQKKNKKKNKKKKQTQQGQQAQGEVSMIKDSSRVMQDSASDPQRLQG